MRQEQLEHRVVKKALKILYRTACAEQFLKDPRICSDKMKAVKDLEDWYLQDPIKQLMQQPKRDR